MAVRRDVVISYTVYQRLIEIAN